MAIGDKILKTEYSESFDRARKGKVVVSYYKYGPVADNYGCKLVDALGSMRLCIDKYKATGNTEYLVDAANYCMFEYMFPRHEKAHYKDTDSDESAGIVGMSANEIKGKSREYMG